MPRRVALVGTPLRRRHSAVMHDAAFAAHGIDATYELRELPPAGLDAFFTEARGDDWLGFQVTAPHKQAVMAHLDTIEPGAAVIGAVNSGVRLPDGRLSGFNTDAPGFIAALTVDLGVDVDGSRAVVVGAGGAARAATWALLDAGAAGVTVANRTPERAAALTADLGGTGGGALNAIGLDGALIDALADADVAVNATTVGMATGTIEPELSFDVTPLPDHAAVFDLVYVPPDTPLVRNARLRGLRAANGMDMLVRQAEIAFERWTGVSGAGGTMRTALDQWLRGTDPVNSGGGA